MGQLGGCGLRVTSRPVVFPSVPFLDASGRHPRHCLLPGGLGKVRISHTSCLVLSTLPLVSCPLFVASPCFLLGSVVFILSLALPHLTDPQAFIRVLPGLTVSLDFNPHLPSRPDICHVSLYLKLIISFLTLLHQCLELGGITLIKVIKSWSPTPQRSIATRSSGWLTSHVSIQTPSPLLSLPGFTFRSRSPLSSY